MHPQEISFLIGVIRLVKHVENDLQCYQVSNMFHVSFLCKLLLSLLKNLFFTIYIGQTAQIKCPDPYFQGQRSLKDHSLINYVCSFHAYRNVILSLFLSHYCK